MTSTIILKTDSKLKQKAQQTAQDLGLTLTSVINGYLSEFVQKKAISFGIPRVSMTDPFGSMPGEPITEKEIKSFSSAWQKRIQEIG